LQRRQRVHARASAGGNHLRFAPCVCVAPQGLTLGLRFVLVVYAHKSPRLHQLQTKL
jgi:hypothetical protein